MTNFTNSSSKQTLEISKQDWLSLADKIGKYRRAKSQELKDSELKSLDKKESEVRKKARDISAKAINEILDNKLKSAINGLKQSIDETNQALDNLKGIGDVIQGLNTVLNFANAVFKVIT